MERHGNISNSVEMDRNINQDILVRLKTEYKRCRLLASILEYKCPFFFHYTLMVTVLGRYLGHISINLSLSCFFSI